MELWDIGTSEKQRVLCICSSTMTLTSLRSVQIVSDGKKKIQNSNIYPRTPTTRTLTCVQNLTTPSCLGSSGTVFRTTIVRNVMESSYKLTQPNIAQAEQRLLTGVQSVIQSEPAKNLSALEQESFFESAGPCHIVYMLCLWRTESSSR